MINSILLNNHISKLEDEYYKISEPTEELNKALEIVNAKSFINL